MTTRSSMRPRCRRLLAPAALVAGALTLAACGSGAAHVIGPGIAPTTTVTTVPGGAQTTTTTSTVPAGGSPPVTTAPPTTVPAPSINQQTVSQIDSELNALDQSLSDAQSAVSSNNPGDQ